MHYERIVQACIDINIDIMQFRQHCARADKQFGSLFWHKSKVFVKVNGPLSSVKLYNKFYSV